MERTPRGWPAKCVAALLATAAFGASAAIGMADGLDARGLSARLDSRLTQDQAFLARLDRAGHSARWYALRPDVRNVVLAACGQAYRPPRLGDTGPASPVVSRGSGDFPSRACVAAAGGGPRSFEGRVLALERNDSGRWGIVVNCVYVAARAPRRGRYGPVDYPLSACVEALEAERRVEARLPPRATAAVTAALVRVAQRDPASQFLPLAYPGR